MRTVGLESRVTSNCIWRASQDSQRSNAGISGPWSRMRIQNVRECTNWRVQSSVDGSERKSDGGAGGRLPSSCSERANHRKEKERRHCSAWRWRRGWRRVGRGRGRWWRSVLGAIERFPSQKKGFGIYTLSILIREVSGPWLRLIYRYKKTKGFFH